MPGPGEPPMGLCGPAIEPRSRTLPQVLRRVVKVHNPRRTGQELLLTQAPHPAATIPAPDHVRRTPDVLAARFEPQARLACLAVPSDRHQTTVLPPRHTLARPRAMLTQTGQHAHCDLAPSDVPPRRACMGSTWDQHASGPQGQGQGHLLSRQGLGRRLGPLGDGGPGLLEALHRLVTSRWHPTPPRARAHHAATRPPPHPGRRGKRHKDRERTAQALAFSAGPLMRLPPQGLLAGGHLRDGTPVWTPSDASLPAERANQGHALALRNACTGQRGPTGRAGGPGDRLLGTCGEQRFDDMPGQDTREGPHGEEQLCERLGLCDRAEPRLHDGIIMPYAVVKA